MEKEKIVEKMNKYFNGEKVYKQIENNIRKNK